MNRGCYDVVHDFVIGNLNIVIGVAVGIIGIQVSKLSKELVTNTPSE